MPLDVRDRIRRMSQALIVSSELREIKEIRDEIDSICHYAATAGLSLRLRNDAATIKLDAERKAGKRLRRLQLRGGDRRSSRKKPAILASLGITKYQSASWQREAAIDEARFRRYVGEMAQQHKQITVQGLFRYVSTRQIRSRASNDPPNDSELHDHLDLLRALLEPVLDPICTTLHSVEKRHIKRLLQEIGKLSNELARARCQ